MDYTNFNFYWYKLKNLINEELPFFPRNLINNIDNNIHALVSRELNLISYWFEFREYILSNSSISKISSLNSVYMENIMGIDNIIEEHELHRNKELYKEFCKANNPKINKFQVILDN